MTKELFLTDSYLKDCDATIISIEDGKIELDQTVFYPAGGGQECDTGVLQQGDIIAEVHTVKREKGRIYHYTDQYENFSLGPVKATIDWKKRYAFMRNHSMLHVLGSVFYRKFGSLCTGNQIYFNKARIDLTEIVNINIEDINAAVQEANHEVKNNHIISSKVLPREEAGNLSNSIKTVVNLIPKSVLEIRLVSIGNIDEQACGGTHVKQTNEIGEIILEKVKSKGKGIMRLELKAIDQY